MTWSKTIKNPKTREESGFSYVGFRKRDPRYILAFYELYLCKNKKLGSLRRKFDKIEGKRV